MATYISPSVTEQTIQAGTIICASEAIRSSIGIHGGSNSGNPTAAF